MFASSRRLFCRWFLLPLLVLILVQANFFYDFFERITNQKPIEKTVINNQDAATVTATTGTDSNTSTGEQLRIEILYKPDSCDDVAVKGKQVYFNFLAAVYTEEGEIDGRPEGMVVDKGGYTFPSCYNTIACSMIHLPSSLPTHTLPSYPSHSLTTALCPCTHRIISDCLIWT